MESNCRDTARGPSPPGDYATFYLGDLSARAPCIRTLMFGSMVGENPETTQMCAGTLDRATNLRELRCRTSCYGTN